MPGYGFSIRSVHSICLLPWPIKRLACQNHWQKSSDISPLCRFCARATRRQICFLPPTSHGAESSSIQSGSGALMILSKSSNSRVSRGRYRCRFSYLVTRNRRASAVVIRLITAIARVCRPSRPTMAVSPLLRLSTATRRVKIPLV